MEEKKMEEIRRAVEEMLDEVIVTREKFTLQAPGLGVKASLSPFYSFLTIHLQHREIRMDPETAEKVKNCLMDRKECEFTKEYPREDWTEFSRFSFDFGRNGAQITITQGERYPVTEALQPPPNETQIEVNNPEILGMLAIIKRFCELREKFSVVRELIEEDIERYLEEQDKQEDRFIRRLAEKFQVDPVDVGVIFKDAKDSFGARKLILQNLE